MIDPKLIRNQGEKIAGTLKETRNFDLDLEKFKEIDEEHRRIIMEIETIRAREKADNKLIGEMMNIRKIFLDNGFEEDAIPNAFRCIEQFKNRPDLIEKYITIIENR